MTENRPTLERHSYRPQEIADATGLTRDDLYSLIKAEIIPRLPSRRRVVLIPAWAYDVFRETDCWPGELPDDDPRRLPPAQRPVEVER